MKIRSDFVEILSALNAENVEYLVVGGYAFAIHAEPRYTKDMDIWVHATPENAPRVWQALAALARRWIILNQPILLP